MLLEFLVLVVYLKIMFVDDLLVSLLFDDLWFVVILWFYFFL